MAAATAEPSGGGWVPQRFQNRATVGATSSPDNVDARKLVLCGCVGGGQQSRCPRFSHGTMDGGVPFGGNRAIECRECKRVVRVEHGISSKTALGRIGSEEPQ
jgi:hypothetical protein